MIEERAIAAVETLESLRKSTYERRPDLDAKAIQGMFMEMMCRQMAEDGILGQLLQIWMNGGTE